MKCVHTMGIGVLSLAGLAQANLIQNGSFELSVLDPGDSYIAMDSGDGSIDGWMTFGGGIDYIGTLWAASDGGYSIDINNRVSGGGVQQTFATVIGTLYTVEFDMSANMYAGPDAKSMNVSAAGVQQLFVFDQVAHGATASDPMWIRHSMSFVATDETTTLRFMGISGGVAGAALDNVSVTSVVPAPGGLVALCFGGCSVIRRRR